MSRLTKLEAANQVLSSIGEAPVNTIEGQTSMMARLAVRELDKTTRSVQLEPWHFNRVREMTLSVDATTGFIQVPESVSRFDVPDEPSVIVRGDRLFDRARNSFVFDRGVTGSAIILLSFEELPEEAKELVVAQASKQLYAQHVGSAEGQRNLYELWVQARALMVDWDCEMADYNMMDDPTMPFFRGSYLVPGAPRNGYEYTRRLNS